MTWPVPYIEQAAYYAQLQQKLQQYQTQSRPILLRSFQEPSQDAWENQYAVETGMKAPILPGTQLFWQDMRNDSLKRYETIWDYANTQIDPTVRPYVDTGTQSCFKLIGTRQPVIGNFFHSTNSPNALPSVGLFFDLPSMMKRNLLAITIMYRMMSPVYIDIRRNQATWGASPTFSWGGDDVIYSVTLERANAVQTSTVFRPGTANLPYDSVWYPLTSNTAPTVYDDDVNFGYAFIFAPTQESIAGQQQTPYTDTAWLGFAGAYQTSTAAPALRTYMSFGAKTDVLGLRNLLIGGPEYRGILTGTGYPDPTSKLEKAYFYGLFASDPGNVEVFE